MTATQFTDDAFNKFCKDGHGTLVGNWFEEIAIRDSTGIGRSVPKFGTKKAELEATTNSESVALVDNTFERIYGKRTYDVEDRTSATIGSGDKEDVVKKPVAETLQAAGRIPRQGERERKENEAILEFAKEDVQKEDDLEAEKRNARFFETTTGLAHTKPDMTQTSLPEFLKDSKKQELQRGPAPDRMRALRNRGLEVDGVAHYSSSAAVSHHTMALSDSRMQADIRLTAPTGHHLFGKNAEFSRPVNEFFSGTLKDDTVGKMHDAVQTLRNQEYVGFRKSLGGPEPPIATPVPSLAVLKQVVKTKLLEKWGFYAFVFLRKAFTVYADHDLLIPTTDVKKVLREDLGLTEDTLPDAALNTYLTQLATMRKDACRVGDILQSLRPILANAHKMKILTAFKGLQSGNPTLEDWIASVTGLEGLKETLLMAFDVPEEAAKEVSVPEKVFLEFYSDLAPLVENLDMALPAAA